MQKNCNPYAVVFIDEVELHLHPSLAQEVVQRFRRSFSNAQFVISTHSPLVIADYKQDEDNLLYSIVVSEDGPEYHNVKNMYGMFGYTAKFNQDISRWNVSKVENMQNMFLEAMSFNQDLSSWNVSNAKFMDYMFIDSPLENNPPAWYKGK